ncbi:hypothetical protein ABE178_16245 [Priestia megaterium]
MKNVDIRVINGYEFDLNTYTEEAHKQAVYLFEEYGHFSKQLHELKEGFSAVWLFEESDRYDNYQLEKKKLQWIVEHFERKLLELDKDYRNKKGLSFKKIKSYFGKVFFSDWFPFCIGVFYIFLIVVEIRRSAPFDTLLLDLLLTILMFYHSRKLLPKIARRLTAWA